MKKRQFRFWKHSLAGFFLLLVCFQSNSLSSQELDKVKQTITISQRYDLRRTVNGKYAGMVYGFNQATWYLQQAAADGSRLISAHYFLTGETAEDPAHQEKALKGEFDSNFVLRPDGSMAQVQGGPAPFIRGFPMAPPQDAKPGDRWQGQALLVVDPRNAGVWTTIPILIEYAWKGDAVWQGRPVIELKAKFAVRFREGRDPKADPELKNAEGTRDATIYLDPASRFPVFVRETVGHETWDFKDGTKLVSNGFILTFYQGGTPMAGDTTLADRRKQDSDDYRKELTDQKVEDVTVHDDPRGIAITLENLRFLADSPDLLPGEESRLDRIFSLLQKVPEGKSILVVGHTAAVGTAESQQTLSIDRAKRIIVALIRRGIDPGRLLFDGKGGTQPIGDNSTDAGRAKNRRVELVILD